jgi:urease accessory protein UreF
MAREPPAVKARARRGLLTRDTRPRYASPMPVHVPNTVDPMAAQMAQLLADSDLDELREIIRRWVAEAATGAQRRMYENFGARLVELKQALAEAPVQPTREELEQALTMMLRLAAQQTTGTPPPR